MANNILIIKGGITAAKGITASGIPCGIKKDGLKDLALIRPNPPALAAGVFTTNLVVSPAVTVCEENLKNSEMIHAVIVNSGNANACTGKAGYENALKMTRLTAQELNVSAESILTASTGVIGVPLPMEPIKNGMAVLIQNLSRNGGKDAAEAIMTTDLLSKEYAVEYEHEGKKITVGGMAKGSGMIQPNMATMLAFIATDVSIKKKALQAVLSEIAGTTFNRITVDGETSTNDTVLCLANGLAGNKEIPGEGRGLDSFKNALKTVCLELAKAIVRDGEGATKFLEISVVGTETDAEAEKMARKIANSLLVKTAFFGKDPNWGRILSAAGNSGVRFDPLKADLCFGELTVMKEGSPVDKVDMDSLKKVMDQKEIGVSLKVGNGDGKASVFTTDLSYEYVKINSEYTS